MTKSQLNDFGIITDRKMFFFKILIKIGSLTQNVSKPEKAQVSSIAI